MRDLPLSEVFEIYHCITEQSGGPALLAGAPFVAVEFSVRAAQDGLRNANDDQAKH